MTLLPAGSAGKETGFHLEEALVRGCPARARGSGGRLVWLALVEEGGPAYRGPVGPYGLAPLQVLSTPRGRLLVFPYLGESLAEVLQVGGVAPQEALHIFSAVLGAMADAHHEGAIHGHLTPCWVQLDDSRSPPAPRVMGWVRAAARDPRMEHDIRALPAFADALGLPGSLPGPLAGALESLLQRRWAAVEDLRAAWESVVSGVRFPEPPGRQVSIVSAAPLPASGAVSSTRSPLLARWGRLLGRRRRAMVQGLMVDLDGRARVVRIDVEVFPDCAAPRLAPAEAERECRLAAINAMDQGLGALRQRWGARWSVRQGQLWLRGRSLALPVALATRAAVLGRPISRRWAFSGDLGADGTLRDIGGVRLKLQAAREAGVRRVALPEVSVLRVRGSDALSTPDAAPPWDLAHPFAHLDQLVERLFPPVRRRWALLSSPVALLLFVVALGVFRHLGNELALHLEQVGRPDSPVSLVMLDGDRYADRGYQARVVRGLTAAGVASIVYDLLLVEDKGAVDDELLAAFEAAVAAGIHLVLPVEFGGQPGQVPEVHLHTPFARLPGVLLGQARAATYQDLLFFRPSVVARMDGALREFKHVSILGAFPDGVEPLPAPLSRDRLVTGPVPRFHRLGTDSLLGPRPPSLSGRIAVVGVGEFKDKRLSARAVHVLRHWLQPRPVQGMEHVATLLDALLTGRVHRYLSIGWSLLVALSLAVLLPLAGWRLPRSWFFPIPGEGRLRRVGKPALWLLGLSLSLVLLCATLQMGLQILLGFSWLAVGLAVGLAVFVLSG